MLPSIRLFEDVHFRSSYLILMTLVVVGLLIGLLHYSGVIARVFRLLGVVVRRSIRSGFLLWERCLSWASWPLFLTTALAFLALGWLLSAWIPSIAVVCGLVPLGMGVTTCLAYMFIDLERYEVARGYKATHNPLKGQEIAYHLAHYGHQVHLFLLAAAALATIGGFAVLSLALYRGPGQDWYRLAEEDVAFADFLAYAVINLYSIVDLLDLANSQHLVQFTHVKAARWPASALLVAFKTFFTVVLLQQVFASIRNGRLLAETIADFWSPHEPIHQRARAALPQYGAVAVWPLLTSLRMVGSLTKEQREQLPPILTGIGPIAVRALTTALRDTHEHVRAVAVAALGQLHAHDALPALVRLCADPSDLVRQSLVEALGLIGKPGVPAAPPKWRRLRAIRAPRWGLGWLLKRKQQGVLIPPLEPTDWTVSTLRGALADPTVAVRGQAAVALGRIGPAAAAAVRDLLLLLEDGNESVRCHAAVALGQIGAADREAVAGLLRMLQDPSAPIKAAAAQALGELKQEAREAVPALVALLQDRAESVRQAAAAAIGQAGHLTEHAATVLVEGLASPDNVVRAQTAEALGTIGQPEEETVSALVEAITDDSGHVRAKVVEALGRIGEGAAEAAVPGLVRALRDPDNCVSALAAEALGEMGESAEEAVPALMRSLGHINPQVRSNAAAALGSMGTAAVAAVPALEKAGRDPDGAVRGQAVRAWGEIDGRALAASPVLRDALADPDPQVRAAAVDTLEKGAPDAAWLGDLLRLLEDPNDLVKVRTAQAIPNVVGALPPVIAGLSRRLLEDDSDWVQANAAQALGRLGRAAVSAGPALLRVAQMGEMAVREQAMRALVLIQPPEAPAAFLAGLRDTESVIRKLASAGWRKTLTIPEEAIAGLVAALRDPEAMVQASAAHALSRLDSLPDEAIQPLLECTEHSSDVVRLNAVLALQSTGAASAVVSQLIDDPHGRVRLIAARSILADDPENSQAVRVMIESLANSSPRVRKAATGIVELLGDRGKRFLTSLQDQARIEDDTEVRATLRRAIEHLRADIVDKEDLPNRTASPGDTPRSAPVATGMLKNSSWVAGPESRTRRFQR